MFERVKKIVVEISVGIILCLFHDFPLDCWYRLFLVVIEPVDSFGSVIEAEGFVLEMIWFDKSGIETGLAD
jgi:hypothetical protein